MDRALLLAALVSLGCSSTTTYTPSGGNGGGGVSGASGGTDSGGAATGGGTATAGAGGTASSWCDGQAVPVGVAAGDHSCVDFDSGMPPAADWAPTVSATGALNLVTDVAASPPQALRVSESAPDDALTETTLEWQATGSDAISSVTISAEINPSSFGGVSPPWASGYSLLCVENSTSYVCLNYTRGATVDVNPYTGYYLTVAYFGGAAFLQNCIITPTLAPNVWTNVELVASTTQNEVRFNDISVGTCGTIDTGSSVTVRFGLDKGYGLVSGWQVAFDNVVTAVTR
jgi:hypothetical protein